MFQPFKIDITPLMYQRALENSTKIGVLKNSVHKGKYNIIGCLVEEMTLLALPESQRSYTYEKDVILKNKNIEIKGKRQTIPNAPLDYYDASITIFSLHQHPDYYIFGRVFDNKGKYPYGWLLGAISYNNFMKNCRKIEKGQQDGNNGFIAKETCYNIRYDQLQQPKFRIDHELYKLKELTEISKIHEK